MDCCDCILSEEARLQKRKNREIEKSLKDQEKKNKYELKLLVLGTGESGKSTFIKQMKIIHGSGYSTKERNTFIQLVYKNIIMAMKTMTYAMEQLFIEYEDPKNKKHVDTVLKIFNESLSALPSTYVAAIKALWTDSGIQQCYARRAEYQLNDSVEYFLQNIDRVAARDYLPSDDDILRVRVPTTAIVEDVFKMDKKISFRFIDVGGQKSERKKWMSHFHDVTSLIFISALSEYDQVLAECEGRNRMLESLYLFKELLCADGKNNPFLHASIILFLNKKDILKQKIKYSHLADYFPEYMGPEGDYEEAAKFIEQMFFDVNDDPDRIIYKHRTCATDTENIRFVFAAVKHTVLQQNLVCFA